MLGLDSSGTEYGRVAGVGLGRGRDFTYGSGTCVCTKGGILCSDKWTLFSQGIYL